MSGDLALRGVAVTMALALLLAGCNPFRRKQPAAQVPPTPIPPPAAQIPPEKPVALPKPPPQERPSVTSLPKPPGATVEEPAKPEKPKPQTSRRGRAAAKPKPAAVPEPHPTAHQNDPSTTAAQPAPPRLRQLMSPEEEQAHQKSIDAMLARAEQKLTKVAGLKLTTEQLATLERARSFMQQAAESRESDPVTAKSLAERADVLASDLAEKLP